MFFFIIFAAIAILFPILAVAQPDPATNLPAYTHDLFGRADNAEWRAVAALLIIGLVTLVRAYGPSAIPWLIAKIRRKSLDEIKIRVSGKVAWCIALSTGALAGLAPALYHYEKLTVFLAIRLLIEGAMLGMSSAGLYSGYKKFQESKAAAPTPKPAE